ncbi:MAG: hypothetical protein R3E79_48135 [Caldilineaceae bacterium]
MNNRTMPWGRYRWERWLCRLGVIGLLLLPGMVSSRPVAAHGGVVIDSGFTDDFEWLVSIDPYPLSVGQATITLLVFDLTTYEPVNDLQVALALAAPGTTRPCCTPAELSEPIPLTIDPEIYPGDYSAVIPLDQKGDWAMQFVVEGGARSFTVVVPVEVQEAVAGQAAAPNVTPDIAATATAFAQNVGAARQQTSPIVVSPLIGSDAKGMVAAVVTTPAPSALLGVGWWLWGIAAIIPILMGWLLLRSPQQRNEDE